jgi:hypothetical protein
MIKFPCPHCGVNISAEPEHYGTSANCPSCSGDLVVPCPEINDGGTPNQSNVTGKSRRSPQISKLTKLGALLVVGLLVVVVATIVITRSGRKEAVAGSKSGSVLPANSQESDSASAPPYAAISSEQEISREELAYALRSYKYLEQISEPRRKDALIDNLLVVANRDFSTRHPVTEIFRSKERLRDYLSEVYSNAKKIETKLEQLEPSDFDALQQIQIDTICWGATLALISKNIEIDDEDASYGLTISSLNGYLFTLGNMAGYAATSGILSEKNDKTADGVMRLRMLIAQYKSAQERLAMSRFRFEDQMKENFGE